MIAEWRELGTMRKIFCIGGVVSLIGPATMILTGMTSIGRYMGIFQTVPLAYVSHAEIQV
ncbi:MAG: hypothetical protein WAN11_24900 [Syntrophobacteraceae bacterium]